MKKQYFLNANIVDPHNSLIEVGGLIIESTDLVAAGLTAIVSAAGTIQSLDITNSGNGYVGSAVTVSIAAPATNNYYAITTSTTPPVGLATASATVSISGGRLNTVTITNPGFGYTQTKPPQVLAPSPSLNKEDVDLITTIEGFDGDIIGIAVTDGVGGNPLALEFFVTHPSISALAANNRVLVSDTVTGFGITSIDGHNLSIVGVGNTFLDNIYKVDAFSRVNNVGILTCNILSTTSVVGIATTGSATNPCGTLSFGKISGFTRSSTPISIGVTGFTASTGLSTFPILQRRGTGLRDTGGLSK